MKVRSVFFIIIPLLSADLDAAGTGPSPAPDSSLLKIELHNLIQRARNLNNEHEDVECTPYTFSWNVLKNVINHLENKKLRTSFLHHIITAEQPTDLAFIGNLLYTLSIHFENNPHMLMRIRYLRKPIDDLLRKEREIAIAQKGIRLKINIIKLKILLLNENLDEFATEVERFVDMHLKLWKSIKKLFLAEPNHPIHAVKCTTEANFVKLGSRDKLEEMVKKDRQIWKSFLG